MISVSGVFTAALFAVASTQAGLPAVPEIPLRLPDSVRQMLTAKRQPLVERKLALMEAGRAINESCNAVERGSTAHANCRDRAATFGERVRALRIGVELLGDEIDNAVGAHTIRSMNALAERLGWRAAERARLASALNELAFDGDPNATDADISRTWREVLARGAGEFAREAAATPGPGMVGAGTQTRYEDCAIFALANAIGLPYDVVATRATKLVGEGEWRDAAERAAPGRAIEKRGLMGGEVVLLAEALGQVDVVPSGAFARTIREGRPVMVNLVPERLSGGHQVVLTKVFQRGDVTWFEMMDSNQGPLRRLYLTAAELGTLLQENGVTIRPEAGTTPMRLR